jgi:two-component system, NtrC family, response regulator
LRRFRPLGGKTEIKSDFRLIVAPNRDLEKQVQAEQFRQDLLFRLGALTIALPALNDRKQDIKEVAIHYIALLCDRYAIRTKGMSPEFL